MFLNLKYPDRRDLDSLEVQGPRSMVRDAAGGHPSIGDIQRQTHWSENKQKSDDAREEDETTEVDEYN